MLHSSPPVQPWADTRIPPAGGWDSVQHPRYPHTWKPPPTTPHQNPLPKSQPSPTHLLNDFLARVDLAVLDNGVGVSVGTAKG